MAEIYGRAACVNVWLGEAKDNSDSALETIRRAAAGELLTPIEDGEKQEETLALLKRPWFQRIWVLQEVAAARHVLILCGSFTIDGLSFCLGLQALKLPFTSQPGLRNRIYSLVYLIRGSVTRPDYVSYSSKPASLDILPLGQLIDIYYDRQATERHDKILALLGMSSDNPIAAGLKPNYGLSWGVLLRQLINFILGSQVSVKTWDNMEMAIIKGKGYAIASVYSLGTDPNREDRQRLSFYRNRNVYDSRSVQAPVKSIKDGDIICVLQGASRPTVIRPHKDYFSIIMIAGPDLNGMLMDGAGVRWGGHNICTQHEFLLVWNWETVREASRNGTSPIEEQAVRYQDTEDDDIEARLQTLARIFNDLGRFEDSRKKLEEITTIYERSFGEKHINTLKVKMDIALMLEKMGQLTDAAELYEQLVRSGKETPEADPVTILSLRKLAWIDESSARKLEKMAVILETKGQCTEDQLIQAVISFDEEVLGLLLDRNQNKVRITEHVIMAVVKEYLVHGERVHGEQVFKLLIERWRLQITTPNDGTRRESHMTEGSHEVEGIKTIITEKVITAALECQSMRVIMLLIKERGEFQVTEDMIEAVIRNYGIRDNGVVKSLLDRSRNEITITENALLASARRNLLKSKRSMLELLLDRENIRVTITEEVLIAVAISYFSDKETRLILKRRKNEVRITEKVLIAAIGSIDYWVMERLEFLLGEGGDDVLVTEAVVMAALDTGIHRAWLMELLGDRLPDKFKITKAMMEKIGYDGDRFRVMKAFSKGLNNGNEVEITSEAIVYIVTNFIDDEVKLLLKRETAATAFTDEAVDALNKNNRVLKDTKDLVLSKWALLRR